jgi:hypothetical protein
MELSRSFAGRGNSRQNRHLATIGATENSDKIVPIGGLFQFTSYRVPGCLPQWSGSHARVGFLPRTAFFLT